MPVKRAKTLSDDDIALALAYANEHSWTPRRDISLILLTCFCGLRIQEASFLHERDFTDAAGRMTDTLFVSGRGAKYGKSRTVPLRRDVRNALASYLGHLSSNQRAMIQNKQIFFDRYGRPLSAGGGMHVLSRVYKAIGLVGASSHSGRRTFGTRTARLFAQRGGSLIDTRDLLGHSDINTTLSYIEPSKLAFEVVTAI